MPSSEPAESFVARLEKRQRLTRASAGAMVGAAREFKWLRVTALPRYWEASAFDRGGDPLAQALAALDGAPMDVAALLLNDLTTLQVYFGSTGSLDAFATLLRGAIPGIVVENAPAIDFATLGRLETSGNGTTGRLTGIPHVPQAPQAAPSAPQPHMVADAGEPSEQIERVVRALRGQWWAWLTIARVTASQEERDRLRQQLAIYSAEANRTVQQQLGGTGQMRGGPADLAVKYIDRMISRLDLAQSQGYWRVQSGYYAPDLQTVGMVGALLRAAFSGADSWPEPLRARVIPTITSPTLDDDTNLNTGELAALLRLPRLEAQGYQLHPYVTFDTALDPAHLTPSTAALGTVVDQRASLGTSFGIIRRDLVRHGFIGGVTRSGKTTTLHRLLATLRQDKPVPFLVIEPAKAEYRTLLPHFNDLLVFTLGDETVAPFRFNPFEFPVHLTEQGCQGRPQLHIDLLKAAFNAAFAMYPPVPFVLERCLVNVYRAAGWDLVSGINRRARTAHSVPPEVFPTLSDLFAQVALVTDELHYDDRVKRDVRGALETRIDSLRLGGKGAMLDTRSTCNFHWLLARPVVMEIEKLADDEEKAFVMGLLIARLTEECMDQSETRGKGGDGLAHVTVLEEAHRLLAASTTSGPDAPATRAKAVETFATLLAEIGGRGESVIIADQIPTKLVPDVIKNSGLKIIHRTVAGDDRALLGAAMVMTPEQERYLAMLAPGEALVYADGMDAPVALKIDPLPSRGAVSDAIVGTCWFERRQFSGFAWTHPGACPLPALCDDTPDPQTRGVCDQAKTMVPSLTTASDQELFARLVHAVCVDFARSDHWIAEVRRRISHAVGGSDVADKPRYQLCLVTHGLATALRARSQNYAWPHTLATKLSDALVSLTREAVTHGKSLTSLAPVPSHSLHAVLREVRDHETKARGPFLGCATCPAQAACRHRYIVRPFLPRGSAPLSWFTGTAPEDTARIIREATSLLHLGDVSAVQGAEHCIITQILDSTSLHDRERIQLLTRMQLFLASQPLPVP